jgi:hypothetical protein
LTAAPFLSSAVRERDELPSPAEEGAAADGKTEDDPMMEERPQEERTVTEERTPADDDGTGKPVRPMALPVGIGVAPAVGVLSASDHQDLAA